MVDQKKSDTQLDAKIANALKESDAMLINEAAKEKAIHLAMAEFHSTQEEKIKQTNKVKNKRQGFWSLFRPTSDINDDRRERMYFYKKWVVSGVSAAFVTVIGFYLLLQNYKTPNVTVLGELDFVEVPAENATEIVVGKVDAPTKPAAPASAPVMADKKIAEKEAMFASRSLSYQGKERARQEKSSEQRLGQASNAAESEVSEEVTVTGSRIAANSPSIIAEDSEVQPQHYKEVGRDRFENFEINPVKLVSEEPVSTFSVDVDTASYSFVRRQLNQGVLPQKDAVRIEEMINYFDYAYPLPEKKDEPFKPFVAVTDAPWAKGKKLLHIGIKGYDIPANKKPRSNLVFLLDVSGSMNSPDKLPLVKQSMELLLTSLEPEDTVAIAVYAGAAGTVLEPTKVKDKFKIMTAMDKLQAGGSTAGAQGIRLAYELAEANFDKKAINRIILATDGDFNVGITNLDELQGFVERKREKGIFLSVLGFGEGNYHDHMMQTLAQNGNGIAAYIDTISEAQKVLVNEATSSLFPIAKDVKVQIEFNPKKIAEYRLIGYETRHLNREDFNNDKIDAGDIGAGHSVTALYEIALVGSDAALMDESRYGKKTKAEDEFNNELAFLKLRYKLPDESTSKLLTRAVTNTDNWTAKGGEMTSVLLRGEVNFATAVAAFAQILKGGQYLGNYNYDDVIKLAQQSKGADEYGYRTEFVQLIRKAKSATAMGAQ